MKVFAARLQTMQMVAIGATTQSVDIAKVTMRPMRLTATYLLLMTRRGIEAARALEMVYVAA